MVLFNRSIYKFAKNDIVKKELYQKLIAKYYFNPQLTLTETHDECSIELRSDAKLDFYLMMKKFDNKNKCENMREKYENNIKTIKNFIKNESNSNYDLLKKYHFENEFESDQDMLKSLCHVDNIDKYFKFEHNYEDVYIFGVGNYDTNINKLQGAFLFSCTKNKLSNSAYYPLFDIDDGFRDAFGNNDNVRLLNFEFYKWKHNNYQGELF